MPHILTKCKAWLNDVAKINNILDKSKFMQLKPPSLLANG